MSQSRRSFIAALAMGTTGAAFPIFKEAENLDLNLEFSEDEISKANEWVSKVKGTKKMVYDGTTFNKGFPVHWNWAYYQSNYRHEGSRKRDNYNKCIQGYGNFTRL